MVLVKLDMLMRSMALGAWPLTLCTKFKHIAGTPETALQAQRAECTFRHQQWLNSSSRGSSINLWYWRPPAHMKHAHAHTHTNKRNKTKSLERYKPGKSRWNWQPQQPSCQCSGLSVAAVASARAWSLPGISTLAPVLLPGRHHDRDHPETDPGCRETPRQHSRPAGPPKARGLLKELRQHRGPAPRWAWWKVSRCWCDGRERRKQTGGGEMENERFVCNEARWSRKW